MFVVKESFLFVVLFAILFSTIPPKKGYLYFELETIGDLFKKFFVLKITRNAEKSIKTANFKFQFLSKIFEFYRLTWTCFFVCFV